MNRFERALSSSSVFNDDPSISGQESEYLDMDMDEEEALRKAARAGIRLLEANTALNEEVIALREQVTLLEREQRNLRALLETRMVELASITEIRKNLMIEASALHNELKAKSVLVTNLLEKEDFLRQQVADAEDAKMLVENHVVELQLELNQLRSDTAKAESAQPNITVANPVATYDSSQTSAFTYADYETLQHRLHVSLEENKAFVLEIKSLRKDVETLRYKVGKLPECMTHIERLEKRNAKLRSANDTLREERMEEQAVLDSLRSMNLVYKKIADSRPFAVDCTCSQQSEITDPQTLGVTVRDVLIEENMNLEAELRELRSSMNLPHNDSNNDQKKALNMVLKRVESSSSNGSAISDTASSCGEPIETANERLSRKVQILTEKYDLSKEMLRHTKVQWCAAIASQKALEECYKSAQAEISQLTRKLDYHLTSDADTKIDDGGNEMASPQGGDEKSKWTEETALFSAPPGDLNSPLIRRLLDYWTTDKVKVMALTDWLHNSIRGTGRATPMRLLNLSSEIAAGFTQLLVPIMRERHGVSVSIYRRDSVHILSDLVLQTNHPCVTKPAHSMVACNDKVVPAHPLHCDKSKKNSPHSVFGSALDSSSALLQGETEFLYG
ncbi:uncharacterized protein PHALS_08045 [Plasmopara halstedii]|uniref:Uncharacterized protein n=1 Tax=Plasmopara halstedii TaxID=4781 RepID=A0A0P1B8P6_PLAHL|nr:uncharacterized protein PHALS_08045 [Plasmopara halstedii]CEG50326.1 hypothetical protein PHALS_08045 [Plasmopara halstedii]|eukprot:XP_024586695.1 hypothetical protein PHALS_08045 [Plasmopara halstedii]